MRKKITKLSLQKKLHYIISFCFLLTFTFFTSTLYGSENVEKDSAVYDIKDEALYAVILYDLKNSSVKLFGEDNEAEGDFRTALIFGYLDLMQLKKQTIDLIKEGNFSLFEDKPLQDICTITTRPIEQALEKKIEELHNEGKGLNYIDALIYYYIFNTKFSNTMASNEKFKALMHNAESIAISRLNHHYWHQKIYDCYQNNYQENKLKSDTVLSCGEKTGFEEIRSNEVAFVLKQLKPYVDFYFK